MIHLVTASETFDAHLIRGWAGVATDEGVGLICLIEVSDPAGRLVCRFEALLPETSRRGAWSGVDGEAAQRLLEHTVARARTAIARAELPGLHGRRLEVQV